MNRTPGGDRDRGRGDLVRLGSLVKIEPGGGRRLDHRDDDRDGEGAPAQARIARIAAPERSPLATNPRAPHAGIRSP